MQSKTETQSLARGIWRAWGQVEVGGDLTWVVEADLIDKVTSEWRT